ncbi:MAG: phosphodiester glycosidase family protein [Actinomycetes bacterium]
MSSTATWARPIALVGTAAMVTALLAAAPQPADAAHPCRIEVTTRLDKTESFASRGSSKYYYATAKGSSVGQYDHKGNVIMTTFPKGAYPELVNKRIGEREAVGQMTKTQSSTALGSVNGDFFIAPDIRYANDIEMVRGPMVKNGRAIRGTYQRQRVVGVDKNMQPFGGLVGIRGNVRPQVLNGPTIKVRALNWHRVMGRGVTVYTTDWSTSTRSDGKATYPRPAGVAEWVLSRRNKIKSIRTSTNNSGKLGAPVAEGTKVLAFSANSALMALAAPTGTKVKVTLRQSTTTGVKLLNAVGRGLPLIEGGKAAPLGCKSYAKSSSAKSARPRTFVGWDGKGRWRTFTVPGSKLEVVNGVLLRTGGFSLANAANIAKTLGMTAAYELDGGGSTTLWTRNAKKWTRNDLYGVSNPSNCTCERAMGNGLAFVKAP